MDVKVGDRVHLPGAGTGIVRERRNRGMVVLELKGRLVVAEAARLEPADGPRTPRARAVAPTALPDRSEGDRGRTAVSAELDLHGCTAAEVAPLVDAFISDSVLAGHAEVRVIHGRSGGTVKAAAQARLQALPVVRGFRLDPRNPGVTIVSL